MRRIWDLIIVNEHDYLEAVLGLVFRTYDIPAPLISKPAWVS